MAENSFADAEEDAQLLVSVAERAGVIALGYFKGTAKSWMKSGNSPVSQADIEVDDFLRDALLAERPGYGWLSEETDDAGRILGRETMFIVDPLDGTRGFLSGDPQWCISAAVVRAGRPVAAVLCCPALERTYRAHLGGGALLNDRPIANEPTPDVRAVTGSRRLNVEIAEKLSDRVTVTDFVPSLAYRLALVAGGEIDGAFARSGAHEWDIAAADLILAEAGGSLITPEGEPVNYAAALDRAPPLLAAGPGRRDAMLALARAGRFLQ